MQILSAIVEKDIKSYEKITCNNDIKTILLNKENIFKFNDNFIMYICRNAELSTKNQRQDVLALISGNLILNKNNGGDIKHGSIKLFKLFF